MGGCKEIYGFDILAKDAEAGPSIQQRAAQLNVDLLDGLEDLANKCEILFCAASAKVAEAIAEEASKYLNHKHIYVDMNAASPMTKEKIAAHIEAAGAGFVDAAVMEPVPFGKHKVPIYISGPGAKAFQAFAFQAGMNLTYISEAAGSASAIKMFRSVFMKGFTMLLLETLQASHKYGVEERIMSSAKLGNERIDFFFQNEGFPLVFDCASL